jgi:Flp pilus assembly protein CpaB
MKIIIIVIIVAAIVLTIVGKLITDKDLSLFAAINGRRMLNQGAEYVLVSKNPLQYMTKLSDDAYNYYEPVTKSLIALADEGYFSDVPSIETWGVIKIDGEILEYKTRILGKRNYVVITIGESGVITPPTS